MKTNHFMLLAGLSLSSLLFSACDKEDILPATPGVPTTGTPPPTNPTTPTPGSPATPPPTDDNQQPPVTTNSLLKEFTNKKFRYDAQNRLVELTYTDHPTYGYTVVYDGDRPVRLNYNSGNYLLYTYEGDKVVGAVSYYGDNLVNYRYTLEYSGDKLVKVSTISYARYDEGRLSVTEYLYDTNGNLEELLSAGSSSSSSSSAADLGPAISIRYGNYDNKPNPMPYLENHLYLPGVKLFVNNPGYRNPGSGKELYTYAYHESGMPMQRSTKLEAHPSIPSITERYAY